MKDLKRQPSQALGIEPTFLGEAQKGFGLGLHTGSIANSSSDCQQVQPPDQGDVLKAQANFDQMKRAKV